MKNKKNQSRTDSLREGEIKIRKRGFTLVEMLVFLFIFALVTVTFYSVWSVGTRNIILAKNRLTAVALANEKTEVVRNLSFDDIAHTTGDPAGNLKQNEDVVRGGRTFHVFTQIKNVDDPFDGQCLATGDPDCLAPIDYKDVKVTISWDNGQYSTVLSSRFVPAGIEQPMAGRGVLVVNVASDKDNNTLVDQSTVHIKNSDTGFDETHSTDNMGRLMLVGLSESIKKYSITLTKNGYETVSTMPPYPVTSYDPVHTDASVVAGAVNPIDMFQNKLAKFTVKTVDYLNNSVSNINYYIKGGRKIGTNAADSSIIIYNLDAHDQTGSNGEKDYGDISPGSYEFILEKPNYKTIGISRVSPFALVPGETMTLTVKVSPDNATALLVYVQKIDDSSPLSDASVHLTGGGEYDTTIATGDDGMAFFPNVESPPFENGDYNLSVTAVGYQGYTGSVTVSNNQLKEEVVQLTAS